MGLNFMDNQDSFYIWFDGCQTSGRRSTIESHLASINPRVDYLTGHDGAWKWDIPYSFEGENINLSLACARSRSAYSFSENTGNLSADSIAEITNLKKQMELFLWFNHLNYMES
jgi:hypothetical protein